MAEVPLDPDQLRAQVEVTYRSIADDPHGQHHCRTGRSLARLLGYPTEMIADLPEEAVESFAGVGNPFEMRSLRAGMHVVDVGSGAGLDSFIAALQVGYEGRVVGIDMTDAMIRKARRTATVLEIDDRLDFREGLAEDIPVSDGWADVVITNGVINLCVDKVRVLEEIRRILVDDGTLQFAEVATGDASAEIDRTDICLAGPLRLSTWVKLLEHTGFNHIQTSDPVDIFADTRGESAAREIDLKGYSFLASAASRSMPARRAGR